MADITPSEEIERIKKKSFAGVLALTSRTFILQIIAFGSTFLLTIFLSPQVFGVFYVVSAVISFLNYFSDIGLAAALIQKKEKLTREDLATTFTIQQALVGVLTLLSLFFSGSIAQFYQLDSEGLWLLRSLIASFFISSLKTIPSVLLERSLEFQKLIIPQILETVGFYVVAVWFAAQGRGIESFTWAVTTRAVLGLVAMYMVSPWRITFGITRSVASKLMKFGLPFQLNSFLALLKDDLMTVFLGKMLPFAEIGYIGWAKKWADVPLRLIMDSVIRVTFPAFSRLQHSPAHLTKAIEKTLFGMSLAVFPVTVGLIFFIEPMIALIPKYGKWMPALPSFYLFAMAALVASLSTPLTNALNAVGKIKTTLALMVGWTAATWILTIIFISFVGFHGYAAAIFAVTLTIGIVIRLAKRIAPFSFTNSVGVPLVAAAIQSAFIAGVLSRISHDPVSLTITAVLSVILYSSCVWLGAKQEIGSIFARLR